MTDPRILALVREIEALKAEVRRLAGASTPFDPSKGWFPLPNIAWSYASATTMTAAGDHRALFPIGTKVRLANDGSTKYFYVSLATYAGGVTTLTLTAGTSYSLANSAITEVAFSYVASPPGHPIQFTWTPAVVPGAGAITSYTSAGVFWMVGRAVHWNALVFLENNGTGSGNLVITNLPVNADNYMYHAQWGYNASVGCSLGVWKYGSNTQAQINRYDGAYPGSTGQYLYVGGQYVANN